MTGISIRARLFWPLLAAVAMLAGAASVAIYERAKSDINELFDYEMKQVVFTLGMHLSSHPDLREEPLLRADHDFVTQVWRAQVLLVSSRPEYGPDRPLSPGFGTVGRGDTGWRTFTAQAGEYTLQVAQRLSERRQIAANIAFNAVLPAAAMLPLGGLIIWFGIGYGLRPIRVITRELTAREPESLTPVRVTKPPVEIAPLLGALNGLLARLDHALRRERQFITDASHELRTPATALGLQVDLLESATTPEQREEALRDVRLGVDRMQRLIEQILTLARMDPDNAAVSDTIDVAAFLGDMHAEYVDAAAAKSVALDLAVRARPKINADATALRALVRNLLDNAIRYTPPQGSVAVALDNTPRAVSITITDSGPGIPSALREQVFARFFRKDGNADDGGTGLGLSIANRAADRLGARLTLTDAAQGRGLTAVIELANNRNV